MIFGKYINRYYLRHAPALLLGILALLMVDYIQLLVPQLYRLVINGVNLGQVVVRGETMPFTKEVLFQHICLPMIWIVLFMVVGRFLWRICFFGTSIRVQADLREKMFDHSRRLSQQYYQVNNNQVNFVVRANMVSVTVWQLKTVVAYWQLVVVKDAKFWLPNSDKNLKTSRNSRLLVFVLSESEFRGAFCYNRKKKNSEEKEDHADF